MVITRNANRIVVQGDIRLPDFHRLLAGVHQGTENAGYQDLVLDLSACTAAFAAPMLAICAQTVRLREAGVSFDLLLPSDPDLVKLFRNANWAYFLDPRNNDPSDFKGYTHIPATQFKSPDDQNRAVNRIVNAILSAIPNIHRSDFAALEWSINEITDNVLTHAQSPTGGLVQVSTFRRERKTVEYIVADAGIGIPNSLRSTHPELKTDTEALDRAIREGVTRDKSVGQGNGLFGSYQICSHSQGRFVVDSGYAKLAFTDEGGLHVSKQSIPYDGTLVIATIDFSRPHLLQEALKFGGKIHNPVDFIETHFEDSTAERATFIMKQEAESFGSRVAGTPVRVKLSNLMKMCPQHKIYIDFSDIALVSSSFADEVFGKLFIELGPLGFMQRFEFRNIVQTVRQLIDRAISQRSATGR